jgi:hypothetical protein
MPMKTPLRLALSGQINITPAFFFLHKTCVDTNLNRLTVAVSSVMYTAQFKQQQTSICIPNIKPTYNIVDRKFLSTRIFVPSLFCPSTGTTNGNKNNSTQVGMDGSPAKRNLKGRRRRRLWRITRGEVPDAHAALQSIGFAQI